VCSTTFVGNQSIALTANVSGANPTGSVTFQAGATVFCSNATLNSGNANCQTPSLTVQAGNSTIYNVIASYGGDSMNNASASAPLALTVLKASDVIFRHGFEPTVAGCPAH
jgi:Bacterial Ig-like domain (group 3)